MADVRSLLRGQRASRRIDHPQAVYSATGSLECSVCHIPLKSDEEVWNKHLRSSQHAMRAERLRVQTKQPLPSRPDAISSTREISNGSKKRKVSDVDGDDEGEHKRTRSFGQGADQSTAGSATMSTGVRPKHSTIIPARPPATSTASESTMAKSAAIDESEWAAFEASLARPPSPEAPNALNAEASISAAPLTAAELAAQSSERADGQSRDRREAELEAEKEDAARALEDEFDEMEGLEDRVKKLKEKREALRKARDINGIEASLDKSGGSNQQLGAQDENESDEDSDDLDEWDTLGITR